MSFGTEYFLVTSCAGEIVLVIGLCVVIDRMQKDLAIAGSFADYLAGSNAAFRPSANNGANTISEGAETTTERVTGEVLVKRIKSQEGRLDEIELQITDKKINGEGECDI